VVGSTALGAVLVCALVVLALPRRTPDNRPVEPQQVSLPIESPRQFAQYTPAPAIPAEPEPTPAEETPAPMTAAMRPTSTPRAAPPLAPATRKPAPKVEAPRAEGTLVVKRRAEIGEDDLVKQLRRVPELVLDRSRTTRLESQQLIFAGRRAAHLGHDAGTTVALLEKRPDLAGLPWRKGDACKITPTAAGHLEEGSIALRTFMTSVPTPGILGVPGGSGLTNPDNLAARINAAGGKHNRWLKPEGIPALQQLLMAEHEAVREVLVDQLARIEGKKASEALAQRALFDLHPRVRERALKELAKRPAPEYRDVLLAAFQHPWPPVAEHAAEALATLKMKETVPTLLAMLDMPDPQSPRKDPNRGMMVKEMVRVNHLLNCLMCHAPALSNDDKVRGRIPPTNQPLPPPSSRAYYADTRGLFVRADITYLRQDFSVPLPVKNHGVWPEVQRFDFLVRERSANHQDLAEAAKRSLQPSEQHRSLFFALRELTGVDPGPTAQDWKRLYQKSSIKVQKVASGFKAARGLAVDREGRIYVSDSGLLLRKEGAGRPSVWLKAPGIPVGLAIDARGNLLAAESTTPRVFRIDTESRERKTLADRYEGLPFNSPSRLAVDGYGGVYFTDDRGTLRTGGTYYLSALGSVTRLPVALAQPRGIGLSPDGKTLYVSSPTSPTVMAYPIESAGSLGKGRNVCELSSGTTDLAVDRQGNLHLLSAGAQTVEIITPEGARLGTALLSDTPVACCSRGSSLYVLTSKALYRFEVPDIDFTRLVRR
jgi:sugar lactone lactonase YvrE